MYLESKSLLESKSIPINLDLESIYSEQTEFGL